MRRPVSTLARSLSLGLLLSLPAAAQTTPAPTKSKRLGHKPAAHKLAAQKKPGADLPSHFPLTAPVCTVNGEAVPMSLYIDRLSLEYAPNVREELVEETLIKQEAKRRKLVVTAEDLRKAVEEQYQGWLRSWEQKAPGEKPEKALARDLKATRGWTPDEFREVLQRRSDVLVLRRKLAEALVTEDQIPDSAVEKQYADHKEAFRQPDSVRISQIVIRRPVNGDPDADKLAQAKAEGLLKAVADGGDFEALARAQSDEKATASLGGKLPIDLPRGAQPFGAVFDATVFAAPVGLVNQVIPSPTAYQIVRVDSKKPGRILALKEVRDQILTSLLISRRDEAMDKLLLELRAKAHVDTGKF